MFCLPRHTTVCLFRGSAQHIPLLSRHARTAALPLRAPLLPARNFHATDVFNATHRTSMRHPPHPHHPRGGWHSPSGPFQRLRQKLDSIPPNYLLYTIIGLNGIVFAAWSYVRMPQNMADTKRLIYWLQDNFINSRENLRQGRFWTLVTSTFSHADPGHALFNGLTFWFLAPTALMVLGNVQFLALYLGSGAFASVVSLVWNKDRRNYHSHGASGKSQPFPPSLLGAIYGLASLFAFAAPRSRFLLFFVIPMPAWACIGGIACFDVYNAITRRFSSLDSAGHVGGLTAGALYWLMRTRFRLF